MCQDRTLHSTHVRLVDSKIVVPRDHAKSAHASSPTSAGFFPLTGMELDGYYDLVPAVQACTPPSDSAPRNNNPAELHITAPTSALLGIIEVVPSAAAKTAQVW